MEQRNSGGAADEVDAVEAAARARSVALVARDIEALRRVLHPDFRWTSHSGVTLDRDAYIGGNTGEALVWIDQQFHGVRTTVVGDTAVIFGMAEDTVVRDGERLSFTMPVTTTWVRTVHGWRCLAGHAGPAE